MKQPGRLLGSLSTLFGGVALSKILGLGRELFLAFAFGTSYVTDAFRVALSAIFLPTHLLTGEALFAAFIPSYKRLAGSGQLRLIRAIATAIVIFSTVITAILLVGAPLVVDLLAPGFDSQASELTARLIRVASAGVVLYALSSLFINIQVAHEDYFAYSARPTVQNLGILAAVAGAYAWQAPILLGLGFVLAFAVMSAWSLRHLKEFGLSPRQILRPVFKWPRQEGVEFLKAAGQLSLYVVLIQISAVVDRIVASLTGEGGVAAVEYAFFVTDSARVVIGVPLATMIVGRLGGIDWDLARSSGRRIFGPLLVWTIALSAVLFVVSFDVVELLYGRGAFQAQSTQLTGASLQGFAVGMWAASAGYVLQRLYNATLRNREVALAGSAGLLVNIVLDLALYKPMGVFGIALATSISNLVVLGILIHWARFTPDTLAKVVLPAIVLVLPIPLLQNIGGRGLFSIAVAFVTIFLTAAFVCIAWPPLRRDVRWSLQRVFRQVTE